MTNMIYVGRFILVILFQLLIINGIALELQEGLHVWPMPESMEYGVESLYTNTDFQLKTDGSKFVDRNGILKEAFSRLVDDIKGGHVVDNLDSKSHASSLLHGINVVVFSPNEELQYGVNESYKLHVPGNGDMIYASLEAETIYGALHGLQTFSQLCSFNFSSRTVEIQKVPIQITDKPRFSYRGLLIDTSRHYQPLAMIKNVLDSMAYAKLNVLHWHIVDSQSFPLEIPSFPKMWEGSYSVAERYTMADAAEIVSYAQRRGISVLSEIDVPGHALSWGAGYPNLWPSKECKEPLDISNEFTFQVIDGILSDFSKVFKYKFVHLGGDEVNTSCWTVTSRVKDWLTKSSKTEYDGYEYFVLRTQEIALKHGYEIVNWEETFNNFGSKLHPKTVVHNWLESGVAQKVTSAGLRCIVSNQNKWYLDHLDASWQDFYMNEPLANISDMEHQKLVIGGEVCMWGETVDASDIQQTIWPRAAAAAERLWTSSEKVAKNPEDVETRLTLFRCLLNQRGIAAAPLDTLARSSPLEPGSCYIN